MTPLRIAYVDGPRLRRTLVAACEHAQLQRAELNRINVFPVPDGDTGTNLALTVRAVADHLRKNRDPAVDAVAREAAEAAVLGARGNCGMMLAHFLLGFSEAVRDRVRITHTEFKEALRAGAAHLQDALERPVEGTILTVMREAAEAAATSPARDFVPLLDHVLARARESLARTPELLPVLRNAGVVDAGAKGFVSLLEGCLLFIHGDPLVAPAERGRWGSRGDADSASGAEVGAEAGAAGTVAAAEAEYSRGSGSYRFCTEALVRGADLPGEAAVKGRLREMGDSLVVIRSGELLKVHIHTDEPEAVFAWLRTVGRLATHKAEDMVVQHASMESASGAGGHRPLTRPPLARRPLALVTDSAADLPEEVVRAHGIQVTPLLLVTGEDTLRDGEEISAGEFHELMRGDPELIPTTSQPAPADFLEAFGRAAEDGEEVLAVLLGSSLSGTFASAEAAAKRFDGAKVHLADTLGVSLLEGLLVLKGAELGEAGMAPPEIIAELRRVRERSGILFTVDTFDRLLASGRVGRGRAFLGSLLSVKPILGVSRDGVVEPVDKALGRKRVIPTMMAALEHRVPAGVERVRFGVVHVGAPEVVEPVSRRLRERWGENVEIIVSPATPVISTHLGLGAWGVAYLVED